MSDSVRVFRYDRAVLERFPGIVGGVVEARGVSNGPSPPALAAAFGEEQRRVLDRIGERPLADLPSLAAWRRAFTAFGVEPTRYRSAAEALLRRLTKHGDVPSLGLLVDVGNLVSIRYALPVAVLDLRAIAGGITVRFAGGDETFTDLGSGETQRPEPGEVIFVDEEGHVAARRWCWRQSAESATRPDTTEILVTVEGLHEQAAEEVPAAVSDLVELLRAYAPEAEIQSEVLGAL
jgi:DNA/RNA-binding domain of Phe-tRNA-synthetase-like protein